MSLIRSSIKSRSGGKSRATTGSYREVNLTGDKADVFTDDPSRAKKEGVIKKKEVRESNGEEELDEATGGVGLALDAMAHILKMLKGSAESVKVYMDRVKEANPTVRDICSRMERELSRASKLAKAAAKLYKEEAKKIRSNGKQSPFRAQGVQEQDGNVIPEGKELNYAKVASMKRKESTPPERIGQKRTKVQGEEETKSRGKPDIRSIQILKEADGGISSESEWEIIKRRKRKNSKKDPSEKVDEETGSRKQETKRKEKRKVTQEEAVVVKTKPSENFIELAKRVKEKVGKEEDGVRTFRQTKASHLLIEFEPNRDSIDFHRRVRIALGDDTKVDRLVPREVIEVRDIDPTVEKDEVHHREINL